MTLLSHLITRMSSVSLVSFVSLIHIIRESLEQQRSNTHLNSTKTPTPTLEHRYCTRLNPPDVRECLSCTSASPIRDDEKVITIDELVQRLKESDTYHLFKESDFLEEDGDEDVVLEKKQASVNVSPPPPPGKHTW